MIDINRWTESITVLQPATRNAYGEYTYTSSIIQGRLVLQEEEIINSKGEVRVCKATLYTKSSLLLDSKILTHRIITKKECKDLNNVINFYLYKLE